MGKRESYEPGTFCWVDLATTKVFYGDLFGWEFRDDEIPRAPRSPSSRARPTSKGA